MTDYGFAARMVKMAPSQKRLATLRADRAAAYIRPGKQMAKIKSQGNITSRRSIAAVTVLALAWLVTPVPAIAQNAYITNQGVYPNFSNSVTVIDTATNAVSASVAVGRHPVGVAVKPDGSKVYVANRGNGTVSVIDATNTVIATIDIGLAPSGIAVTPDGSKVYVTNLNNTV